MYFKTIKMDNYLPNNPFENLALSLSGGGYRAASFHLGLMTYLSSVRWNEKPLLERVRILSTVSGGTFAGVCYATAISKQKTFKDCYYKLYRFMNEVDVIDKGLKKLEGFGTWDPSKGRSLINALSLVYYDEFEQNTFSNLFDDSSHIKEIIFNTTEFTYGLPFRFQKTSVSSNKPLSAYYGNKQVNMPIEAIREVKLADVIAASSCFPMGFEPINFPDDFRHDHSPILDNLIESHLPDRWGNKCKLPVGLMDGGIVDNQGIDSVINAEKRMKKYTGDLKIFASEDVKAIDLYIISDVSSPFMNSYVKTEENKFLRWRNWSFKTFLFFGVFLLIAGLFLVIVAIYSSIPLLLFFTGFFASIFILFAALSLFLSNIFRWALKKFEIPVFFINKLHFFSKMKFGVYETLIKNRITSVISMVSEVFMKQIRRQEYGRVYNDIEWRPRLIMNAIYELSSTRKKETDEKEKGFKSEYMGTPSEILVATADKADSMGTTLWFTSDELQNSDNNRSKLNALIACGQFTGCYNLLVYIEKTLWGKENSEGYEGYSDELKTEIRVLHGYLLSDWKQFNENPYWMVDKKYKID